MTPKQSDGCCATNVGTGSEVDCSPWRSPMTQQLTSTRAPSGADVGKRAERAGTGAGAALANARAAVDAAERAFADWAGTAPGERRRLLEAASELLMERQADIAALVTEETRGTLGWGAFN